MDLAPVAMNPDSIASVENLSGERGVVYLWGWYESYLRSIRLMMHTVRADRRFTVSWDVATDTSMNAWVPCSFARLEYLRPRIALLKRSLIRPI
jgi:hypothetical protein